MSGLQINRISGRVTIALSLISPFMMLSGYFQPPQPDEGTAALEHGSPSLLVEHLLAFCLVVVAPIMDHLPAGGAMTKLRGYRTTIVLNWGFALLACATAGIGPVFTMRLKSGDASWLLGHWWARRLVELLLVTVVALFFWDPAVAIWKNWMKKPNKWSLELEQAYVECLGPWFPATVEERRLFVVVCISAGVCEEVLYRGFLLHYLHVLPFSVSLMWSMVLSSVIFGIRHFYQGTARAVLMAVVGLILYLMFVLTGNLFVPIVVHVAMNLRALLLSRSQERT